MKELYVYRFTREGATIGALFLDHQFLCFTLEDPYQMQKIHGQTRIPAGRYRLSLRTSPKFSDRLGHDMVWITEVPAFNYIYFHPGNFMDDTDGCVLVGDGLLYGGSDGRTYIAPGTSKRAYDRVYPIVTAAMASGELEYVTITDLPGGLTTPPLGS